MLPASSLRNTVARSIRREVAGDPQSANVKMRTGPNIGPIAAAIAGVGIAYWAFTKKESNTTDKKAKEQNLQSNDVARQSGGGGSLVHPEKQNK
ncbi:hypothetical protein BX666DRAFT_2122535 [Dichotomocladium elegans]|nr:hypothetical protein BX666DRAFT_2122535 [Dichotomocladium elegans]